MHPDPSNLPKSRLALFLAGALFTLIFAIYFATAGTTIVNPGQVGVRVTLGTISPQVQPPGFYTTVFSSMRLLSTQIQTYTMAGPGQEGAASGSVNVLAKDQLPVLLDVSVMFHLNGHRAVEVVQKFGEGYADSIVHPLVRTAVRNAASEYITTDLIDKRAEMQARMNTLVRAQLAALLQGSRVNTDAVVVDEILVRNIDLPATIDEAIANVQRERQATVRATQANLTARQEAARVLTVAQGDSAQQIARAEADARMLAIHTRAEADAVTTRANSQAAANRTLAASLTPALLAYQRIDVTRAVLSSSGTRTVFLPGASPPSMLLSQ